MRCDYIRGTFRGDQIFRDGRVECLFTIRLLDLKEILGGVWVHKPRGVNGYAIRFDLERDGEVVAWALTEGSGDAAGTHQVEAKGGYSAEVKAAMDKVFGQGGYATARRDTCLDIIDDDDMSTFDALDKLAQEIAKTRRVQYNRQGQGWLGIPGETRTFYLGSRTSPVMVRCYMRGLKTIKEGGQDDPRRVRIEVEVKPGKRAGKDELTRLTDAQLFGCSGWSREFMQRADLLLVERVRVGTVWTATDQDRVINAMMKQYGRVLRDVLERRGADGLAQLIRHHDESKDKARALLNAAMIDQEAATW